MKGGENMRKYSKRLKILRELFNAPPEEHVKQRSYYSPLIQIIRPWVYDRLWDLLPKYKKVKNPKFKTEDWLIAEVLANMLEYATPSLQVDLGGSSRNRRTNIIPSNKLRDNLVESLEYITTFHNEDWDKLFIPIFEDFIKLMKSFRDFNMESLADFLATNEIHDLWLIVATNKDYNEESTEDRFSL
jgi:hypothetical protein